MDPELELKQTIAKIGEAVEALRKAQDEELKGIRKGLADYVTSDKLEKLNKSVDDLIEHKAKLEKALADEKAHVDELERKLNRQALNGNGAGDTLETEIKSFNGVLGSLASGRNRSFTPLDVKGYGEYKAAINHYLREGKDNLTPDEVKILSVGSDPDGGYWVTPDLSGAVVKKIFETSDMRSYAASQTISTDALEGIEDLGEAGAGYAGEHSQGPDTTTPQIGKWRIPVFILDTEPKATQQLLDDSMVDVEAWLAAKVADKLGRFENGEFINGAAARIRGFIGGYTPLADSGSGVTWGSYGYLGTGVNANFAATNPGDNLVDLIGLLKNAYLPNAKWFTRRSVITKIRKFKDGQGNYLWAPGFNAGQAETILGYPVARMEDIPTLANGSISLAFGDMKQAYQIVDRQGIRVLRDPFTAKPYVKFYTTKRTGGGGLNFEALKLLKFS